MADGEFEVGDVVRLKSGGPKMNITAIKYKDEVWVVWMAHLEAEIRRASFPMACLVKWDVE